jgi:hypothetical protein
MGRDGRTRDLAATYYMAPPLFDFPASGAITIIFIAMLVIYRCGIPLEWSIIGLTSVLALWTGGGGHAFTAIGSALLQRENVLMLLVIGVMELFI